MICRLCAQSLQHLLSSLKANNHDRSAQNRQQKIDSHVVHTTEKQRRQSRDLPARRQGHSSPERPPSAESGLRDRANFLPIPRLGRSLDFLRSHFLPPFLLFLLLFVPCVYIS